MRRDDPKVLPFVAPRRHVSDEELQQAVRQRFQAAMAQWEQTLGTLRAVRKRDPRRNPAPFVRDAYEAVEQLLDTYIFPTNWANDIPQQNHLPLKFFYMLLYEVRTILAGRVPELIQVCAAAHRPAALPRERDDIIHAVQYIIGAKEGKVQDRTPIKTVRKAFGVGERTVQQWVRKHRDRANLDVGLRHLPPGETPAQHLNRLMREAGERYRSHHRRKAHRSHHANKAWSEPVVASRGRRGAERGESKSPI